jgi:5'-3' exonuclease
MGIHNGGIFGSLNSLRFAIKMLQPSRCIVVFDGKGGSQRRRKLYSEYKNNRRGMKNVNRTFK